MDRALSEDEDEAQPQAGTSAPVTTLGPDGHALFADFLHMDDGADDFLDNDADESDEGEGAAYLSEEDLQEDYDEHGKLAYLNKCEELRIVPVSQVLKYLETDEVQVTHYGLGFRGAAALAEGLRLNRCIRILRLGDNAVGGEGVEALAEALAESKVVEELDLSENKVGNAGCKALARILGPESGCQLSALHLRGNRLGDRDAIALAEAMGANRSLTFVDLSYNSFGEKAGAALGSMLEKNDELLELNLGWNALRVKGTSALMEGLKVNKKLATLNLGWNGIGDAGGVAVADAMAVNATLVELIISCNGISESVFALAEAIKKNEGLACLELDQNNLGLQGGLAMLEMLEVNKGIVAVSLEHTHVAEEQYTLVQEQMAQRREAQKALQKAEAESKNASPEPRKPVAA